MRTSAEIRAENRGSEDYTPDNQGKLYNTVLQLN